MLEKVLLDSRHKFVYFDEGKKEIFINSVLDYSAKIDNEEPIAVYIKDDGLPKVIDVLGLEIYKIRSFHNSYYEMLIALSVVDRLIEQVDKDVLNERMVKIFDFYSSVDKNVINNIDEFRKALFESMMGYKTLYSEYIRTGNINGINNIPIITVIIDTFMNKIKNAIGLKSYFCILYDYDELSSTSMMTINNYISSRCNGYLSMNILCDSNEWKCYYDNAGNLIEDIHDYVEIYDSNVRKRTRHFL